MPAGSSRGGGQEFYDLRGISSRRVDMNIRLPNGWRQRSSLRTTSAVISSWKTGGNSFRHCSQSRFAVCFSAKRLRIFRGDVWGQRRCSLYVTCRDYMFVRLWNQRLRMLRIQKRRWVVTLRCLLFKICTSMPKREYFLENQTSKARRNQYSNPETLEETRRFPLIHNNHQNILPLTLKPQRHIQEDTFQYSSTTERIEYFQATHNTIGVFDESLSSPPSSPTEVQRQLPRHFPKKTARFPFIGKQ